MRLDELKVFETMYGKTPKGDEGRTVTQGGVAAINKSVTKAQQAKAGDLLSGGGYEKQLETVRRAYGSGEGKGNEYTHGNSAKVLELLRSASSLSGDEQKKMYKAIAQFSLVKLPALRSRQSMPKGKGLDVKNRPEADKMKDEVNAMTRAFDGAVRWLKAHKDDKLEDDSKKNDSKAHDTKAIANDKPKGGGGLAGLASKGSGKKRGRKKAE